MSHIVTDGKRETKSYLLHVTDYHMIQFHNICLTVIYPLRLFFTSQTEKQNLTLSMWQISYICHNICLRNRILPCPYDRWWWLAEEGLIPPNCFSHFAHQIAPTSCIRAPKKAKQHFRWNQILELVRKGKIIICHLFWNSVPECGDAEEDEEDSEEKRGKQYVERQCPNTLTPAELESSDTFIYLFNPPAHVQNIVRYIEYSQRCSKVGVYSQIVKQGVVLIRT